MFDVVWQGGRWLEPAVVCVIMGVGIGCGGHQTAPSSTAVAPVNAPSATSTPSVVEWRGNEVSPVKAAIRSKSKEPARDLVATRRPLTSAEKDAAVEGSLEERERAFEAAREQRESAERLAAGIRKGELKKIDAELKDALRRIGAAHRVRMAPIREQLQSAQALESKARARAAEQQRQALAKERAAGRGLSGKTLKAAKEKARLERERTFGVIDAELGRALSEVQRIQTVAARAEDAAVQVFERERAAAHQVARKAREQSRLAMEKDIAAAADAEQAARDRAELIHDSNCRLLDSATITDFVVTQ